MQFQKKGHWLNRLLFIGSTIVISMLLQLCVVTGYLVVGDSMLPNYKPHQHVLVWRQSAIHHGSVVVLKAPDKPNEKYIKRVIGLPGDHVAVSHDQLYVNHQPVTEPYLKQGKTAWQKQHTEPFTDNFALEQLFPVSIVPKDMYFVMGDNRPISNDGRYFGFVSKKAIEGVVHGQY